MREREREIRKEYELGGGTSGMYHHHPTKEIGF
jgi:hypothetical protein